MVWDEFDNNSPVIAALKALAESRVGQCSLICGRCRRNLKNTRVCMACGCPVHRYEVVALSGHHDACNFKCMHCGLQQIKTSSCAVCTKPCVQRDMRKVCSALHANDVVCGEMCIKDKYACRGCYKQLNAVCICTCCHRRLVPSDVVLLDTDNYDMADYNVASALDERYRAKVGSVEFICLQCDKSLLGVGMEYPKMPRSAAARRCDGPGESFQRAIRQKPEFVCTCCHRWRFSKNVLAYDRTRYNFSNEVVQLALADEMRHIMHVNIYKGEWCAHIHPTVHDIYDEDATYGDGDESAQEKQGCVRHAAPYETIAKEYICDTCHRYLIRKKPVMPPMACANGLKLDAIPPELADLNEVERNVLALRIPFMSLFCVNMKMKGAHKKIQGGVTNVPTHLDQIAHILPRMSSEVHYHPMLIKRKMSYKSSYRRGKIRKEVVMKALDWLKKNNERYRDIQKNDDWFGEWETSDLRDMTQQVEHLEDSDMAEDIDDGDSSDTYEGNDERTDAEIAEDIRQSEAEEALHGAPEANILEPECFENEIYACAPGEDMIPKYMLLDEHFEECAFPDMFPMGKGGFNTPAKRWSELSFRQYAQQRILNVDGRFSKVVDYLFSMQYGADVKQVQDNTNMALRLNRGKTLDGKIVTAGMLKNVDEVNRLAKTDQAYKMLKKVRGSPPYWQHQLYEVLAMVRALGKPTFFMTLSAADLHWREMLEATAVHKGKHLSYGEIRRMKIEDRADQLKSNPALAAYMFQYRLDTFINTYLKHESQPLGKVTDSVCKIEFQQRGAPHAHCLLWVDGAPVIDVDSDDDVIAFIDKYISGKIPKDGANAKLIAAMVRRYQVHHHSRTCRIRQKDGSCTCRFDMPKPPCLATVIARECTVEDQGEKKRILRKAADILELVHREVDDGYDGDTMEDVLKRAGVAENDYKDAVKLCRTGRKVVLAREPGDACVNAYNPGMLRYWGANVDLQYVLDEHSTVMYICSYMMKSEKEMGEVLKAVSRECRTEPIKSQLKKIGKAFLGKRVVGAPEAAMRLLSLPLIKKTRQMRYIDANRRECRVSMPKPQYQLERLDDDDEDVYMTSWQDRYSSRPDDMEGMCLAKFAGSFDPVYKKKDITICETTELYEGSNEIVPDGNDGDDSDCSPNIITLKGNTGKMRKRLKETIPLVKHYKESTDAEAYYHARLMLYKPWREEAELLDGYSSYAEHYFSVQDEIEANARCYNLHEKAVQGALEKLEREGPPEAVWDKLVPASREEDAVAGELGVCAFTDTQEMDAEEKDGYDLDGDKSNNIQPDNNKHFLSQLYGRMARRDTLEPARYRALMRSLNTKQRQIVMYSRRWCKDAIARIKQEERRQILMSKTKWHNNIPNGGDTYVKRWIGDTGVLTMSPTLNLEGYKVFLSGAGGTGKTYVIQLIYNDIVRLFLPILGVESDQPLAMLTAPTGTAAFNIDGTTLHSAFQLDIGKGRYSGLPYDSARSHIMKNKLQHVQLLVIDEVSMVGQKTFQEVSLKLDQLKASDLKDWGGISVLAVGDLMQLNPIGQNTVYRDPRVDVAGDMAPLLWDDFLFHELDEPMRQRDIEFASMLNAVRMETPIEGSHEDSILRSRELSCVFGDPDYPALAVHVYARNVHCDNWNKSRLNALPTPLVECRARDRTKDAHTSLANISFPKQAHLTGNLHEYICIKKGARVMLTANLDVSDGLTNGAIGTVAEIKKPDTSAMVVFVKFDNPRVGVNRKCNAGDQGGCGGAVAIPRIEVTFGYKARKYIRVSRTQFPLMLAWAVTIHKCQGATLPAVVVDMSASKGKFQPGQAYVAFSRVRKLQDLHILNYDREQIIVNEKAVREMKRPGKELLPCSPTPLACKLQASKYLMVCHINIRGLLSKLVDVAASAEYRAADVVLFNETKLDTTRSIALCDLGLNDTDYIVYRCDRDVHGGGVMAIVRSYLLPQKVRSRTHLCFEHLAIKLTVNGEAVYVVSLYKPPLANKSACVDALKQLVDEFHGSKVYIIGDMNEDLLDEKYSDQFHVHTCLSTLGFQQHVACGTTDRGSLLDHIYTSNVEAGTIHVEVEDCYYSDHDLVTCIVSKDGSDIDMAAVHEDSEKFPVETPQSNTTQQREAKRKSDYDVGGTDKKMRKRETSEKATSLSALRKKTVKGNASMNIGRKNNTIAKLKNMVKMSHDDNQLEHRLPSSNESYMDVGNEDIVHVHSEGALIMPFVPVTVPQRIQILLDLGIPLLHMAIAGDLPYEGVRNYCIHGGTKREVIAGDGNCLFRSFCYCLLGTEAHHDIIRAMICSYICAPANWYAIQMHIAEYDSGASYVGAVGMDKLGKWGTDVEIFAFAQMTGKDVVVHSDRGWERFWSSVDGDSMTRHAFFIENVNMNHYNVVLGVS